MKGVWFFLFLAILQVTVSAFSPSSLTTTTISSVSKQQQLLSGRISLLQNKNNNDNPYHHLSLHHPSKVTTTTRRQRRPITQLHATTAAIPVSTSSSAAGAWISMTLLAIQFATQPLLTKRYTPKDVNRNIIVMFQEILKFLLSGFMLYSSSSSGAGAGGGGILASIITNHNIPSDWSIQSWFMVALVPSFLYALQGVMKLVGYQKLDGFTFNVLNQTKTLASALCCFLLMGQGQTPLQIVALILLFGSACIMEGIVKVPTTTVFPFHRKKKKKNDNNNFSKKEEEEQQQQPQQESDIRNDNNNKNHNSSTTTTTPTTTTTKSLSSLLQLSSERTKGVVAVLVASLASGLAGAVCQKSLQLGGRNTYFFTMELSVASSLFLLFNNMLFPTKKKKTTTTTAAVVAVVKEEKDASTSTTTTTRETTKTTSSSPPMSWKILIPMVTNAIGGILVGLVTKQVGTVKKGFALIFGLLLSGILQAKDGVTKEQVVGAALASISLWMHVAFKR